MRKASLLLLFSFGLIGCSSANPRQGSGSFMGPVPVATESPATPIEGPSNKKTTTTSQPVVFGPSDAEISPPSHVLFELPAYCEGPDCGVPTPPPVEEATPVPAPKPAEPAEPKKQVALPKAVFDIWVPLSIVLVIIGGLVLCAIVSRSWRLRSV